MDLHWNAAKTCDEREAAKKGHIHIDDIACRAERFGDIETILLMHHSPRYAPEKVPALVQEALPQRLFEKVVYSPKVTQCSQHNEETQA